MTTLIDSTKYDKVQIDLMSEKCILVDKEDNVVGESSKEECHLIENIEKGMLHRAFSVFLFNEKNELLLQKRSNAKITFPSKWTNTCCSHPLACEEEFEEKEQIGVKRAAQRKLTHELGIPKTEINIKNLKFLTRIYYKASSNEIWGEHEIDHILLYKTNEKQQITLIPNENEVSEISFVSILDLKQMIETQDEQNFTPWFFLIIKSGLLFSWWEALINDDLNSKVDLQTIHSLN
eukprot:TRINITY_DN380_c0_g1_i1.p1 TRINITY_DN380_c0_g1~~TRINITY_DN380_c0_g1_i1.p1  ORF type:complete len:235 (-),score=105.26 TRINITY_DN380_c0_g1_i1:112-816(-)